MKRLAAAAAGMLAVWVVYDFTRSTAHDLRDFEPREVAKLEATVWRSDHDRPRLFAAVAALLRRQFNMPFWRSCLAAWYAARADVVFQQGHDRAEYLGVLPDLVHYYGQIRRVSATRFDPQRAAQWELEWWIVRRQREQRAPADLDRALAELQGVIYGRPAEDFAAHARFRAEAMRLRDSGGDWGKVQELLERSWEALYDVVNSGGMQPGRPRRSEGVPGTRSASALVGAEVAVAAVRGGVGVFEIDASSGGMDGALEFRERRRLGSTGPGRPGAS